MQDTQTPGELTGSQPLERAFTTRAFVVGGLASLALGLGVPYGTLILRGSYMDLDFSTPGAIFLLFVITALLNPLLGLAGRRLKLGPRELIVVYVMTLLACSIPTMGLTCQLLPIMSGFHYYASPENHWADLLLPHIPEWLVPVGPGTIKYFYEGLPPGVLIPWVAWLRPLGWWFLFIFAFQAVSLCLMVIVRKQWVENERLIYPLVQLPMEMVGAGSHGSGFYRLPALWAGFGVPFLLGGLIGLHNYFPAVPAPQVVTRFSTFRKTQSLILRLSFPMIGFFYLVEQQTSFSLWFFNLLSFLVRGGMNVLHIGMSENLGIYGSKSPVFAHIGIGAFLALVYTGLRVGRLHFAAVWRKAVSGDPTVDDSGELLPYRTAVGGLVVGLTVMCLWLVASGLPAGLVVPFVLLAVILFLGLTRVVAESGMAEAVAPSIAPGVLVSALGSHVFGPRGLMTLGMSYVWLSDMRIFVMATAAHGLKLTEEVRGNRRPMLGAMVGGILIAIAASIPLTLYWAYNHGGTTLNNWFWVGSPNAPAKWVMEKLQKPSEANMTGWLLTGLGAVIMLWLTAMRQQIMWWPFHPLGFALGGIWMMDELWATIFLTWILKGVIMRYGGVKAFQKARPFFLGLILGQFATNAFWLILDAITGHTGNQIFWI